MQLKQIILRLLDPLKSLRTQYQIQIEKETRRNQKVIANDNDELELKRCPKKQKPSIEKPQIILPYCPG